MGLLTRSKTKTSKTDFEPEIAADETSPLPRRASRGGHGGLEHEVMTEEEYAPPLAISDASSAPVEGPAAEQPIDEVVGEAIGTDEDRSFDTAVLSVLEIEGPTDRLLTAFEEFNRQAATRPAGQLLHGCSPSARGIVVYDLWASRSSLDAWLSATPGSPKPQITFLRGVRVVDPTTWMKAPEADGSTNGPMTWSEPLVPATDVSLPAPVVPPVSLPAPMVTGSDVSTSEDPAQ